MQNFNFFQWIREGVKHSVLQGMSDAVEVIGTPDESAKLHPTIAAIAQNQTTTAPRISAAKKPADTAGRKRLGRSLKDIENPT